MDPFHSLDILKNHFASVAFCRNSGVYNVQNGAVIELSFVVSVKDMSVGFVVVCKSCRMLIVVMMGKWSDHSAFIHNVQLYSVLRHRGDIW